VLHLIKRRIEKNTSVSQSSNLQEIQVKIQIGNLCKEYALNKNYYCGLSKNHNLCFGTSGSPLMFAIRNQWFIYGLTSYTVSDSRNCNPALPSFFTVVPVFLAWIKSPTSNVTKSLS
jgi:hypothetical protein